MMLQGITVRSLRCARELRRLLSTGPIKRVGVVGLGLMGHGVAQITATAGYDVIAVESDDKALAVGMERIKTSLDKMVSKTMKEESAQAKMSKIDSILGNIQPSTNVGTLKDCDLIIEAIIEKEDVKCDFYTKLGPLIKPDAIFASNTSSLPITNMALASQRPDKFVGLHFFNPVQIMKLVEVIRTNHTDSAVFDKVSEFGKSIGKVTVSCIDSPGFIVNRLLIPYLSQAMAMVDREDASVPDIDISMKLGAGHPMGPLTLADYVGLDVCYNVLVGWKEAYPDDPSFFVPKCLEEMVNRGELGRKTGKGFYHWDGDKVGAPVK